MSDHGAPPILALAARSLRIDLKSPLLHLLRCASAFGVLLVLLLVFALQMTVGAPGLNLYAGVLVVDFCLVSVLAIAWFSSAITEERQEGSLDLLRMAGLGPLPLLLGKSLAQLTGALALLVVQLPFVTLAIALGGVSIDQILWGFGLLGAYLLLGFGVGLCASTLCREGAAAARWTLIALLVAAAWPAIVLTLLRGLTTLGLAGVPTAADAASLTDWTIWGALARTASTAFDGSGMPAVAALHLGLGALAFGLAFWGFDFVERRAGREAPAGRPRLRWIVETGRAPGGPGALIWKDYRLFVGGRRGLWVRAAAYLAVTILLANLYSPWGRAGERALFGHGLIAAVLGGIVLDLGALAARVFRDEIGWQTYSSLLTLPMSVSQLAYGKILGCLAACLPAIPFLVLGILCSDYRTLPAVIVLHVALITLLTHLLPFVVHASLHLQRGAFPLTMFAGISVLAGIYMLIQYAGGTLFMFCFGLAVLLFLAGIRVDIGARIRERLRELSGSDI